MIEAPEVGQRRDDRPLPCNLDAERAVLGALLITPTAWAAAAAVVAPDDFYRRAHQVIFRCMVGLLEAGTPIDFTILTDALRQAGALGEIGGPAYLTSLTEGLPHATNVAHYAGIVRETARLRAAIRIAAQVMAGAYEREATATAVIEEGVTGLLGVADAVSATVTRAKAAVDEYAALLDSTDPALQPVPSGYADLDRLIGGWQRGDLAVVAARTSVGKSSFALGTARAMAKGGTPSAFVSLEMSRRVLAGQLLAWDSKVSAERIRRKLASEREYLQVGEAWTAMADFPLFLIEATRTLTQVAAWTRRLKDQHGVGAVVVDYLQLLMPDDGERRGDKRHLEVAAVSRGLKRIAMDVGVVMIALAQLNRAPDSRSDKRPHLSDLRESGNIEQDADVALLLFREEMHKAKDENEGIAEVIVAKNRSGPTGTLKLYFDKNLALFRDLAG